MFTEPMDNVNTICEESIVSEDGSILNLQEMQHSERTQVIHTESQQTSETQ